MIQASSLQIDGDHYRICSPEQCWQGSLSTAPSVNSTLGDTQNNKQHNHTIAIDCGMGVAPIIALYRLWQNWEKASVPLREQELATKTRKDTMQDAEQESLGRGPAMHLIVFEPYPLTAQDAQYLFNALAKDEPELQSLAQQWPLVLPGMHRLEIAGGRFTVTLLYGAQHGWRQVMANIDGLVLSLAGMTKGSVSPAQQDEAGQDEAKQRQTQRWSEMLRLSQAKTWALVNASERSLLQDLGARLHTQWQCNEGGQLHEGDTQKLIMHSASSSAVSAHQATQTKEAQTYQTSPTFLLHGVSKRPNASIPAESGRHACVIGAGLAGAGIAYALALRGWRVTVIDKTFKPNALHDTKPSSEQTAPQETQTPQDRSHLTRLSAALTPLITVDDSHKARLSRAGTLRAHARWKAWGAEAGINPCGTLELNRDKGYAKDILEAVEKMQFPREWVHLLDAQQASELSGLALEQHGAFFPYGMQISPLRLIQKLLSHPLIECVGDEVAEIKQINSPAENSLKANVIATPSSAPSYVLISPTGEQIAQSHQIICATALATAELLQRSQLTHKTLKSGQRVNAITRLDTLHPMGGEAMHVPAELLDGGPQCIVAGQGYLLPAFENYCVMGGTYVHNQLNPQVSEAGQEAILRKIPIDLDLDLDDLRARGLLGGWAGSRAVVQGRMPVIGPLSHAPGIFLACAYASHGLTWSSLAGDLIAAYLEGEPMPIERDLWQAICPR